MAWGSNGSGQCNVPSPNKDFVAVAGSASHSLGLKVNGKIVAFLCSNLPSPPPGTPACPAAPGTVEGTIEPADVLNTTTPPPDTAGQGIEAGAFGELVDAIKAGATYANVHSAKWPGGEIRAQLEHDNRNGD